MGFEELKAKAAGLPLSPGVYIMRDSTNTVIYVGKAKKLKNRVSQYFQETASHSPKTKLMVSKIDHFDVIIAASEFEALVLECSLIKRHMPKYNILLKDDKGFPYIRLDLREKYPRITMVNRLNDDGAAYFGPFGSRGITQDLLDTIQSTLLLPTCNKVFPKDIGKTRPCLRYHMNQCEGWCRPECSANEYRIRVEQARQLLLGNYKQVAAQIKQQMLSAADDLNFELAASLRNRLKTVEALGQKQQVTAGVLADTDVIGIAQNATKSCFTVLHYSGGNLIDKDFEILGAVDDVKQATGSLLAQYYMNRGYVPKRVLLPFTVVDSALLEQLFEKKLGRRLKLMVPQRGDNRQLIALAEVNAKEELSRVTSKEEHAQNVLTLLKKMLRIPELDRIEAYDISNISGTDIVGGMIVFAGGRPRKSDYKRFSLRDMDGQDDYGAMRQVVERRFMHYLNGDAGFDQRPDLILIDGGIQHAQTALAVLENLNLNIPVFGMVKDDRHRTRALVTPQGEEIAIDTQQSVFALIGTIQEETHRFAISYHRTLRSKRLRYSELDAITGIGPKRKQDLLKTFKSISAIKEASVDELRRILPADAANSVYKYFQRRKGE